MRLLVSVLVFCLLFPMFSMLSTAAPRENRIPNRFARLFPANLNIDRVEDTGVTTLTFNAHDYNLVNKVKLTVFTIPANEGTAEITYPEEWLDNGELVTVTYTPVQSFDAPHRVLLVVRMENAVGDWRNWNVGFFH